MSKAVIQLEPLTCPSCIKKIENVLSKTTGVDQARVLFSSSKVKAEFDSSQIKAEQLVESIEKLGYSVLSFKHS
jgi:copper chaperone